MHALTTGRRRGTTFPKGSRDRPDERQLNAILSFAWEGLLLRSIFNYLQSGFPSLDVSVRANRPRARSVCFKWQGANSLFPPPILREPAERETH